MLVPSVLCGYVDHLAVVLTVLFRVGLMTARRVRQCHGPLASSLLSLLNIGVPVTVHRLITIDKDMVISVLVLYTF